MAIGTRMGKAYVSIEADLEKFGVGMAAKIRAELEPAIAEGKVVGRDIGKAIVEGIAQSIEGAAPALRTRIKLLLAELKVGNDIKIKVSLDEPTLKKAATLAESQTKKVTEDAKTKATAAVGYFESLFGKLSSSLSGVGAKIDGIAGSLKSSLGFLKSGAAGTVAMIYGVYEAALALFGAFNAVGREMLNLLQLGLLLPGVIAVAAAIAAPLMLSFQGISKAWNDMGDTKKFNEDLKSLSQSAANFMRELKDAKPWFNSLAKSVQEGMFRPLVGIIPAIVSEWGPALKKGMTSVSEELGYLVRGVFETLRDPKTQDFLTHLFDTAKTIISLFEKPLGHLATSLRDAADAALPILQRLGGDAADLIDRFATWLDEKIKSGDFEQWINDGIQTLKELGTTIKEIGGLLGVLFDEGNQDGESFIVKIGNMAKGFKDFAASPDGKFALQGIAAAASMAGAALYAIIWTIGLVMVSLGSLVEAVKQALYYVGLLEKKSMGSTVGSLMGQAASAVGSSMGTFKKKARGGITDGPEVALIGEAGTEAVIPLSDPRRARQLADQSGLTSMIVGSGEQTTQIFYLGTERVDARMVRTVRSVNAAESRSATYGGLATAGA